MTQLTTNFKDITTSPESHYVTLGGVRYDVSSTYWGKDGCACGCRGTHLSTDRTKKMRIQKFQEMLELNERLGDETVEIAVDQDCYFSATNLETGRMVILYVDGRN